MKRLVSALFLLCATASAGFAKNGVNVDSLVSTGTWTIPIKEISTEVKHFPYITYRNLDTRLNFLTMVGDSVLIFQQVTPRSNIARVDKRVLDLYYYSDDLNYSSNGLGGTTRLMNILKQEKTISRKGKVSLKIYVDKFYKVPFIVDFNKDGTVANITIPSIIRCTGELKKYNPDMYDMGSPASL